MSEAHMPNNPHFPEPQDPVGADFPAARTDFALQASRLDSDAEAEDWLTVNFPNAISIDEIECETPPAQCRTGVSPGLASELTSSIATWHPAAAPEPDIAAETAVGTAFSLPEAAELVALIQQLRQRNNDLAHEMAEMENALHDCQSALQLHKTRAQAQQVSLAKQTQDLASAQAQVLRATRELESSRQEIQRQQTLIQTLTEHLQTSQQRLAQIERECTLTQLRCSEQTQRLLQSETTCRDLRSRLARQQRQTLQFKAALEKCLETPAAPEHARIIAASLSESTLNAPDSHLAKALPIQPWTALPPSEPLASPPPAPPVPVEVYLATATDPADALLAQPEPSQPNEPLWQDFAQLIDKAAEAVSVNSPAILAAAEPDGPTPGPAVGASRLDTGTPSEPAGEAAAAAPPNWPAPEIRSANQAKKRQSPGGIQLPTFPRL
jgi:hypothetical protein